MEEQEFTIKERIAGYRELNRLEAEERAKETVHDRARSLALILSQNMFHNTRGDEEVEVWRRWAVLREVHERR
jgi:hypothetical protein